MTTPALAEDRCETIERRSDHLALYVHLRDYLELKIAALRREVELQAGANAMALRLAQDSNDVRATAKDHRIDDNTARLAKLEDAMSNLQGRMFAGGAALALFLALIQVGMHFWGTK